jgi:hypothetical protein
VPPFEEYVRARGPGLVQLGYALSGNPRVARDLALEALVWAHRRWSRIEERPDEVVEQELVQAYVAWWRRPPRPSADHPLATLSRTERAVRVLRYYRGYSAVQIADAIGAAVRRHLEAHQADPDALAGFVDGLYPPEGLLEGVWAKSRELSRRRGAVAGGVAAAVLAAIAVIGATRPGTPQARQTPPDPDVSTTIVGDPQPMQLEPADFALPAFPYEPTYLPPDPGPARVFKTNRELLLEYADISLGLSEREPQLPGTSDPVSVGGQAAKLYSFSAGSRLDLTIVWRVESQWLSLHTFGISLGEALRIADGVRPGRIAMEPPPFTITLAPRLFNLLAANSERICIGRGTDVVGGAYGLCVYVSEPEGLQSLPPNNLQRTTVNGLRVEVADFEGMQSELRLYLNDGRVLVVSQNALTPSSKLDADDLVRFAAAVRIGPPTA